MFSKIFKTSGAGGFFAAILLSGCISAEDAAWEMQRQTAINRKRQVIYNTDGCDAVYFPAKLPATKENFIRQRLQFTRGSEIDSVFYCPLSSGFNFFTAKLDSAELLTVTNPDVVGKQRNITQELVDQGTDPLRIAVEYCRREGLEVFLSLRVNDTHDQDGTIEKPFFLMPQYKRNNPHLLMGGSGLGERPPFCLWSAMDFAQSEVREKMAAFVREFCEKYDIDGIEYDFMRHMQLFKTVAWGGTATEAELKLMTDFMVELRCITEEVGKKRGKPILVAIRVPDSADFCRAVGIDLEQWLKKDLVDLLITTSYFRLEPWQNSIALARKYGVKYYASMDESRVRDLPLNIPRRNSHQSYRARFLEAMECGADGIYLFNMEGSILRSLPTANIEKLRNMEKIYYARVLGSNGYLACSYLRGGDNYSKLPTLEPEYPEVLHKGSDYEFDIFIADDIETPEMKAKKAIFTATLGINAPEDAEIVLYINDVRCELQRENNIYSAEIPAGIVKKGYNRILVSLEKESAEKSVMREYLKGDVMPRGRAQGRWRRLFDFDVNSGEAVIDGAYTMIDNNKKTQGNFIHPLPKRKGEFAIEFTMKGDRNGDKGTAVARVAAGSLTETVIFEPEKITFANAGKSVAFNTADAFHDYRLISEDGKTVTLFADGRKVLDAELFANTNDSKYALRGYTIFMPWMDTDSFLIGSLSAEGMGRSAWKNIRFADAVVSLNDFALQMVFKKDPPEQVAGKYINAPAQVIGEMKAANGNLIVSKSLQNHYRKDSLKVDGNGVLLDHDCANKHQLFRLQDTALLNKAEKPLVVSWKMKEVTPSGISDWSFVIAANVMTANKNYALLVFRFGKNKVQVPWNREINIPGKSGIEHSYNIVFDPATSACALWIDGKFAGGGYIESGSRRPGSLYFGDGSGIVSGKVLIRDFKILSVK